MNKMKTGYYEKRNITLEGWQIEELRKHFSGGKTPFEHCMFSLFDKECKNPESESKPETFEPKDGDIAFANDDNGTSALFIHKCYNYIDDGNSLIYHAMITRLGSLCLDSNIASRWDHMRPATESEKQLLFDKLKEAGKRWNPEKKCIEDIPEEPKIGDYVIAWGNDKADAITGILTNRVNYVAFPYAVNGRWNKHIVPWNGTREHLEKVRRGEV